MRVMLIDDCHEILVITAKLLRCHGHEVYPFDDARDALRVLRFNSEGYDVIVTDYQMPIMNGMILAKHIKVCEPLMPVILYSACDPIPLEIMNKREGSPVSLIFRKPVKSEDLHNGILAVYMEACSNRLIMQKCSCGFPDKSLTHACPHIKFEVNK